MTRRQHHNKAYAQKVRWNHGGKKTFGCDANMKRRRQFGIWAFTPSRGSKNGERLF